MEFAELEHRMRNASLKGYSQLDKIPAVAGIYTAWLDGNVLLYVGKAGGGEKSSLKTRIRDHFLGRRGGDQFCVYVYDFYIHKERCRLDETLAALEPNELTRKIDKLIRNWIRERVTFRYTEIDASEIDHAEKHLRSKWCPLLNAVKEGGR